MTFEELNKVNQEVSTILIKNKVKTDKGWEVVETPYATVSARVMGFRKLCPNGRIDTSITYDETYVYCDASVYDDECNPLATGHSREFKTNKFATEVAESSAVGRALGFVGIGIQGGISTAEDIQKKNESELFDVPILDKDKLVDKFVALYTLEEQVTILNRKGVKDPHDISEDALQKYVADREK